MKSMVGAASAALLVMSSAAWAQGSQLNTLDKTFVKTTEAANLAQVKLGELAQQRAEQPAVKILGRWMAADDGFANKRLEAIAKKSGDDQMPQLTEKDKALQQKLQKASGSDFDQQYLTAVKQAEKKGIHQFQAEAQSGQDPHLKTYATNLTPVLQRHLAAAQQLASAGAMTAKKPVP